MPRPYTLPSAWARWELAGAALLLLAAEPSRPVSEWKFDVLHLKNGRTLQGLVLKESADAVEFQERASTPGTLVHTRLEWARLLTRRGRPEDAPRARRLLDAAKAGARQVNLPVIEERIDQLLAQLPASDSQGDV